MGNSIEPVVAVAPAKVNLFLAVTGLQEDGFHSLVSWVVQLAFGDRLSVSLSDSDKDLLLLDGVDVCCSVENNLVWRALQSFRSRVPDLPPVAIRVEKKIPIQAGLGGGSSDAVTALAALNSLAGNRLSEVELRELAYPLGADCSLFFGSSSAIIRGRGDQVESLESKRGRMRKRVMLFKPFLGVDTTWAYCQLMREKQYMDSVCAEQRLNECIDSFYESSYLFYNTFEPIVFGQMLGLRALVESIRSEGIPCGMSGSGSACFAILESDTAAEWVSSRVHSCWGQDAFMIETELLS